MSDPSVRERMREDWNRRAREDANYYAAFGRREQNDDEFLDTGAHLVTRMEEELKRLPARANRRAWRALEIGCGPGRLMKPLSRNFGEIHGVDVSDVMIALARERLAGIPQAHVHATDGTDLSMFADDSFDFVYSYAVFQHIPDPRIITGYMHEIRRVLKPGGVFRGQFNGLPQVGKQRPDTWTGSRIDASEIRAFTRDHGLDLLELSDVNTQYLLTTWHKRHPDTSPLAEPENTATVRRITNSVSSEPAVTPRGRYSAIALWVENLPDACELNSLTARVDGREANPFYVGPAAYDGSRQLGVYLPAGTRTGLLPISVEWNGRTLLKAVVRVIPQGPPLPRVVALSDGIDLLSTGEITSGLIKLITEEMDQPSLFSATVSGRPVDRAHFTVTDPVPPRCVFDFSLPAAIASGEHVLEVRYGTRCFVFPITVIGPDRRKPA